MQLFKNSKFDFIGKGKIDIAISGVLLLVALGLIFIKGPSLSIEFVGGTLLQVKFNELPPVDKIRDALNTGGWSGYSLQTQPQEKTVIIRVKEGAKSREDISSSLMSQFKTAFPGNVSEIPERVDFVGPVIGKKLALDALFAILGSLTVIVLYIAYRFRNWTWGVVAVIALAHDVFLTLGLLVGLDREITLVVIAALLALSGYAVNDTIVIFDRVRENFHLARKESRRDIYNRSINETLSRTFNVSFMALLASGSLFFGGEVLFDFALAMTFGVIVSAFSTIGFSIALIYFWETRSKRA